MAFKTLVTSGLSLESPEAMFRDIRTKKIPGLLSQQADILREYVSKTMQEPDVAIQLPTGSGKTLVGLLIGEWRRRKFQERVVFLCPTNQLVYQVVHQATELYGLKVHGFVGKKSDYTASQKGEFTSAESIAITSYSSVFNSNPFFKDSHLLILDDAHSAENYITKMWSLRISKVENFNLFRSVVSVFLNLLSWSDQQKLKGSGNGNSWESGWVELIPTPQSFDRMPELINVLDTALSSDDSDLKFSWARIRDHLPACQVFLSPLEILIRPLIPPTFSHNPFCDARQRVYMSATLGEGGELERTTGRAKITRLNLDGWEKQGIGRRFFVFPRRSLSAHESTVLIEKVIQIAGRTLVVVPDEETARDFRENVEKQLGYKTFDARDIEVSKSPFTSSEKAVAVVANRYDGIDFPENECRVLVVAGLPRAINLQERFFIHRIGAIALLNDRILTRVIQAFGRCTRTATDYSAVIVDGEELSSYLLAPDRRAFLHPELQAELEFGIEQSKNICEAEFLENLGYFLGQTETWQLAEKQIVEIRDRLLRRPLPGTSDLANGVRHEVEYQNSLWNGNYSKAFDAARVVLGNLNDGSLRGYRALWSYFAGSAAWLAYKSGVSGFDQQARAQFDNASKAAPAISWLVNLSRIEKGTQIVSDDQGISWQVENLENQLERLGTSHDRKFEESEKIILDNLNQTDSKRFEHGHEMLGSFLGFHSGKVESSGSPDPWWILEEGLCLVFEDHSDADPEGTLHISKARQAASHPNWIRANVPLPKDSKIIPILITPVKKADKDALPHLGEVYVWDLSDFRQWAVSAIQLIRDLRREFPGSGDAQWRSIAAEKLKSARVNASSIVGNLVRFPAGNVLKPN